jgi:hypothetical protein
MRWLLVMLSGCALTSGTLDNPDGTNAHHFYNVELQPILTARCGSCHADDSMGFVPDYDAIVANPVVNGDWNPGDAHLMLQTPALVLSAAHSTLYSYVDRGNIATWLEMEGELR